MTVEKLLKTKGTRVVTIKPTASVRDVTRELAAGNFGALIVSKNGKAVDGIISERDVIRAMSEQGPEALALKVSAVMTREVVTCSPKDKLDDVLSIMSHRRFRHLPVVDDGGLAGVISMTDLMRKRMEDIQHEADAMRQFITGR